MQAVSKILASESLLKKHKEEITALQKVTANRETLEARISSVKQVCDPRHAVASNLCPEPFSYEFSPFSVRRFKEKLPCFSFSVL